VSRDAKVQEQVGGWWTSPTEAVKRSARSWSQDMDRGGGNSLLGPE
jgi:hypothetical protein